MIGQKSGRKTWWLLLLAGVLAALMLLSACGGGDDDDDAGGDDGGNDATETAGSGDGQGDDDDDDSGDDDDSADETLAPGETPDFGAVDSEDGPQVCDLLTTAEVSDVLGTQADEGEEQDYPPFYGCNWSSAEFDSLNISLLTGSDAELEVFYELTEGQEVDGLGDRAQFSDFGTLEILYKGYDISISVYDLDLEDDAATLEAAKAVAEMVLDRVDDL